MAEISIVHNSDDLLSCQVWRFSLHNVKDGRISLDSYIESSRETKRHKMKVNKKYDRLFSRNSSIKREDVPLPEDVKDEALQKFISTLTVTI